MENDIKVLMVFDVALGLDWLIRVRFMKGLGQ